MLRQKLSRRATPIRRSRSHTLAPAAVAACSSSRPSSPAIGHVIGPPRRSPQSGSTPHEREHNLHPHYRALSKPVTHRQRLRAAADLPAIAFLATPRARHQSSSPPNRTRSATPSAQINPPTRRPAPLHPFVAIKSP